MVQAADDYVRVIIRRPHAYFFLGDLFRDRGGLKGATPSGSTLGDGSAAPLPGVYVLDSQGKFEASTGLTGSADRDELVRILAGSR